MVDKKQLEMCVKDWYRFPDKFAEECLGIQLTKYQKKLLKLSRMLYKNKNQFVHNILITNHVGIGCVESIAKAVLFQMNKIIIACHSGDKVDEYARTYDFVVKHYSNFLSNQIENMSDTTINFKNGSSIEIVVPKDRQENGKSIRGNRAKHIEMVTDNDVIKLFMDEQDLEVQDCGDNQLIYVSSANKNK